MTKHAAPISALVFDAYGTLYDVHSVIAAADALWPGRGRELSTLWRAKQLETTWLRSLMGRYVGFDQVTGDTLSYAMRALGLTASENERATLLEAYLHLAPFPEVPEALAALASGRKLAILSNGTRAWLAPLVANSGLGRWIGAILTVEPLAIYKPTPAVYQLAVDGLGVPKEAIGFVSSNGWDACGAKAFGFRVAWINRANAPADALGVTPDVVLPSLAELPAAVARGF